MREIRDIMGTPVSVEIVDVRATKEHYERVFAYFRSIDEQFSTYKQGSEISKINRGDIQSAEYSRLMKEVFEKAENTKQETAGYFDIATPSGAIDPSGLVKGWAVQNAAELIRAMGFDNFYVEAGGDIQTSGVSQDGTPWSLGIRNPFTQTEIVKVVYPKGRGVATSGTYIRGEHMYDPHTGIEPMHDIVSFTVIGPNVYEADRFATAAFVMGTRGIEFVENRIGFEGYAIHLDKTATVTSGFETYTTP